MPADASEVRTVSGIAIARTTGSKGIRIKPSVSVGGRSATTFYTRRPVDLFPTSRSFPYPE
jgi:hypothetical protein